MKLISELCQNHNGDIDLLRTMICDSALNGADICKIQSIKAESLTHRDEYESFRKYDSEYKFISCNLFWFIIFNFWVFVFFF